jgi:Zn-dependent membrane protease YugP
MPIMAGLALLFVIAVLFGPHVWVRHVLSRHSRERSDLPGTGGELARHLLDEAGLQDVSVALTQDGDHYDPDDITVRLLPQHYDGRSIAAVAVAAHEVSHAVQHARGDRAFARRIDLIKHLTAIDTLASVFLLLAPVVFIVVKAPSLFVLQIVAGLALLAIRIVIHLVTLPVEFDASFNKALPVLERGGYLTAQDLPAARQVLRAAAWTYVAAALVTLVDLARWARVLR